MLVIKMKLSTVILKVENSKIIQTVDLGPDVRSNRPRYFLDSIFQEINAFHRFSGCPVECYRIQWPVFNLYVGKERKSSEIYYYYYYRLAAYGESTIFWF